MTPIWDFPPQQCMSSGQEQQTSLGAKMKLKEMHQELTNERNRFLMLEAQSKQNAQKQGEEMKALHARMQQTHEQHHVEVNAMKCHLEQLGAQRGNEGAVHRIQRLEQENKQLQEAVSAHQAAARNTIDVSGMQQQIKILQDELQKNVSKLTMGENAREKLESRLKKSENVHKDNEAVLKKRMSELNEALKHMENKNKSMSHELDAATGTLAKRDNELTAMRNQMKEMEKAASSHSGNIVRNLENKLSDADSQRAMLEDQLRKIQQNLLEVEAKAGVKDDEVKMLRNENAALKEELKSTRQRTSGEGQEAAVVREEPCGQVQASKMSYDTNNIVKEKETALANLRQELAKRDSMVNELQVELQKLQSDRSQLQSSSKNTESAVSNLQSQLNKLQSEKESAVNQLQRVEQENKTLSVQLQATSKDQGTAVNKLQEEIKKLQSEKSSAVSKLEAELQKIKKENNDLSTKVQTSSKGQDSAVAQLQDDIKKLTADLEKQRQKNNALREKNWKAMDALSKAEKTAETATDLKSSLANKESEIDRLKTMIRQNEDNKELQEKEDQLKELQSQVSSRSDQLTATQQQLTSAEQQLTSAEQQLTSSKQELTSSQQQLQQLQASYDDLQAKSNGQDAVDNAQPNEQKVNDLQAQIDTLQKENATLKARSVPTSTTALTSASSPKIHRQQERPDCTTTVTASASLELEEGNGKMGVLKKLHDKEQDLVWQLSDMVEQEKKVAPHDEQKMQALHKAEHDVVWELANTMEQEKTLEAGSTLLSPEVKELHDQEHRLIWELADQVRQEETLESTTGAPHDAELQQLQKKERETIKKLTVKVDEEKQLKSKKKRGKGKNDSSSSPDSSVAPDVANGVEDVAKERQVLQDKENDLLKREQSFKQQQKDYETKYQEFLEREKALQKSLQELEQQKKALEEQSKKEREKVPKEGKKDKKSKELEKKQEAVAQKEKELASKEAELNNTRFSLEAEYAEKKKEMIEKEQQLEERLKQMKNKESEVNAEKAKLTQSSKSEAEDVERVKEELMQMKDLLDSKQQDLEKAKQDLGRKGDETSKTQERVEAQVASANSEASNTIQDLTKQLDQLRSELTERNTTIENLQQQYNKDIVQKSADLEQQNVSLNSRLNESQTEFMRMKQQLETEVNQLKSAASAASESKLQSSPADLERIQNLEKDLSQRDSSISQLQSQLDSVNSQLSELLKNQQRNEESQTIAAKSMQELAQIKNDFNARLAEFERTKQELELIRKENHALQAEKAEKVIRAEATPVMSADRGSNNNQVNGSQETRDIKGTTVVTRVEEKSTLDVSRILADKDALHAELLILRSILTTKEKELEELKEKYGESESESTETHTETHKHTHTTTTMYVQGQSVSLRDLELLRKQLHARELHIKGLQEQVGQLTDDKRGFQEKIVQHQIELHSASGEVQDSLLENLAFKTTEIEKLREIVKEYWIVNNELRDRLSVYEESEADDGSVVSSSTTSTRRSTRSRDSQAEMVGDLQKQLASKANQLGKLSEEVVAIKREAEELLKNQQRNEESQTIAAKSMQELAQIKNDFNARLAEFERTKQELELIRKENHELREKNSKAIDTMVKSDKGQTSQAKGDVSSDKQQRATRELLQRLFPHVSVRSSLGHNEWMSAFEKEASKYLQTSQSSSNQSSDVDIEEHRQIQGKLQAQVQHYKNVLAETEGILNRLQSSVENEETKWQQRVKTAEDDASKAKEEIKRLKSEMQQKGSAGKAALASTNGEGTSV